LGAPFAHHEVRNVREEPLQAVRRLTVELERLAQMSPYRRPDLVAYQLWAERAAEVLEQILPGLAGRIIVTPSWITGRDTLELRQRTLGALDSLARDIAEHPARYSHDAAARARGRLEQDTRDAQRAVARRERSKRRHELLVAIAPNAVKYVGGLVLLGAGVAIGQCMPRATAPSDSTPPAAPSAPATIQAR
jgi:hypothetical protein